MHFAWNVLGRSAQNRRGAKICLFFACAAVPLVAVACGKSDSGRPGAHLTPGETPVGDEPPGMIAEPGTGGEEPKAPTECADVDKTYAPKILAEDFVAEIDNPLFPLVVGATYKYAGEKRSSTVEVTPTEKTILGVKTMEVHEVITEDGKPTIDTLDWYAQDKSGTVWRLGRAVKRLEGATVLDTDGSWEAGKDGAQPGMLMPAAPGVGEEWRQAYHPCHVDDLVKALADSASITTTAGSFTGCLQTLETSQLDPSVNVEKYYCKDRGLVLRDDKAGGYREGLTEHTLPTPGGPEFPEFPEFPPMPPMTGVDAGAPELPAFPMS